MFRAPLAHRHEFRNSVCAAYGTGMLIYVITGNKIWSMELWLMSYNIMWMFIGCGLRDLVPIILYGITHNPIDHKIVLPIIT